MLTIIYTCIMGQYDHLNEIKTTHHAICFTDQELTSATWEIIKIKFRPKIFREIKISPRKFLPHHDRSVWIDGNLSAVDIDELISEKVGFWAMTHPHRNCIYEEAVRCVELGKDQESTILKQMSKYYNQNYPLNNGMVTSSLLIRNNTEENNIFAELWWREVKRHSVRDQLSFNYVVWKTGLQYCTLPFLEGLYRHRHLDQ